MTNDAWFIALTSEVGFPYADINLPTQNSYMLLKLKLAYLLEDCQQQTHDQVFYNVGQKEKVLKICSWIQMLISPWEI